MVAHAEAVAKANGLEIEYIRKKDFRKEDRIQTAAKNRFSKRLGSEEKSGQGIKKGCH
jgi:hypothetical protein